jgi:cell division protease FtsH
MSRHSWHRPCGSSPVAYSDPRRPLDKKPQTPRFNFSYLLIGLLIFYLISSVLFTPGGGNTVPYSDFLELVEQRQVESLSIAENRIDGLLRQDQTGERRRFTTVPPRDEGLIPKLREHGVEFSVEASSPLLGYLLSWILPFLLIFWIWTLIARRMASGGGPGGILSMTKSKAKIFIEKDVKTSFQDVAGIEEAKDELHEIVDFLRNPGSFSRLGGRSPKGVLLVGPPGTGKTLLARAVAGEAKVPFFSINGSEFVEMFVGLGAARVRDLFEQARKQAPCILFIDEVDALGKSRAMAGNGMGSNDEKEQTLNQLLAEMDGFDSSEGVILLAATNRPEVLDPALLRAGRFDRQILLSNPDHAGRLQILSVHVKKIKLDPEADLARIAALTAGFSGADLANLVNEAALVATRSDADRVRENDFSIAAERIVAGLEHRSKVINASEKRRIAYHEMGHATVALSLKVPEKVHKISIVPRGMGALGYTLQRPLEDRYLLDEPEMINKIKVLLGGRACEMIFCATASTGASDDLAKATDIARAMVAQFGMNKTLGLMSVDSRKSPYLQSDYDANIKQVSEGTAREIDIEVRAILQRAYEAALEILERHREFLEAAVSELLEVETLDEQQVLKLWNRFTIGLDSRGFIQ